MPLGPLRALALLQSVARISLSAHLRPCAHDNTAAVLYCTGIFRFYFGASRLFDSFATPDAGRARAFVQRRTQTRIAAQMSRPPLNDLHFESRRVSDLLFMSCPVLCVRGGRMPGAPQRSPVVLRNRRTEVDDVKLSAVIQTKQVRVGLRAEANWCVPQSPTRRSAGN